jgi:hypothetical protein
VGSDLLGHAFGLCLLGWIAGSRSGRRIPADRLISLALIRSCRELHPFAACLWQGDLAWRHIERFACGNVEKSVFCRVGESPADHVALVPTLAYVTRQPTEQRRGVDRTLDTPEFDCDVPDSTLRISSRQPGVTDVILRSLGMLVRRMIAQVADLVFMDLHGRFAKLLLRMIEDLSGHPSQLTSLDLKMTQSDLAAMVGGSRQSVNQILRQFERRGYLPIQGQMLIIKTWKSYADVPGFLLPS